MAVNPFNPILDQPQNIEAHEIDAHAVYRLANHDLCFAVDAETDLRDLVFPWADETYARHIRIRVSDVHSEAQGEGLTPMVTRIFNGYQEVILGDEGVIISKRLAVPLGSNYDRSVLWMLDCQAEGDRLLRLDVEIDWGEPLIQRMVDGLLVAQRNPGRAQGVYEQQNADSTRVFGNPQGRPSALELDDAAGRATLTYYVLVNGMVEVPLLLTISDVGEQVAWNGFLALRDAERVFELSVGAWDKLVHTGRLWTADPQLNRALQAGRLATARQIQRVRTGMMPRGRALEQIPDLIKSLDVFDFVESRNLLAMVRRIAERAQGRLPARLPVHPKAEIPDPGYALVQTNRIYLAALWQHLQRRPDPDLLAQHAEAVRLCAEALVQVRFPPGDNAKPTPGSLDATTLALAGAGLRQAVNLATHLRDSANAMRWESEACEYERLAEEVGASRVREDINWLDAWQEQSGWQLHSARPWQFATPDRGVALAGDAVWRGCGLQWRQGQLAVYPRRGNDWAWWALLDLPLADGTISLVWDGTTLHSTRPIRSEQTVHVYDQIRARNTDELEFDLWFEMRGLQTDAADQPAADPVQFRPRFATHE
ncbi:MAG: hypothetical protein WDZ49_01715 [Litorilinea sp.]